MSKVFNMMTGGGSSKVDTTMLYALGYSADGDVVDVVANGAYSVNHLLPSTLSTLGSSSTASYSYVRLGPIDFKGKQRFNAVVTAATAGGTTSDRKVRVSLFASANEDARSYDANVIKGAEASSPNPANGVSIVESSSDLTRVVLALDVSNYQTGSYYVYCGVDTKGSGWSAVRNCELYGINYDAIT